MCNPLRANKLWPFFSQRVKKNSKNDTWSGGKRGRNALNLRCRCLSNFSVPTSSTLSALQTQLDPGVCAILRVFRGHHKATEGSGLMASIGRTTLSFDKQAVEESRQKRQKTLKDFFGCKKESDPPASKSTRPASNPPWPAPHAREAGRCGPCRPKRAEPKSQLFLRF